MITAAGRSLFARSKVHTRLAYVSSKWYHDIILISGLK
jgi:hypothetical protein